MRNYNRAVTHNIIIGAKNLYLGSPQFLYTDFLFKEDFIMAVIRVEKIKNYTVMSNYHLQDNKLSLKAKGLLSVMLSLPDDWDYSINGLVQISKENETAIKSALKELKDNGYIEIIKHTPKISTNGKFEYEYIVYEKPKQGVDIQGVDFLPIENLTVENQVQLNTNIQNTNKQITKDISNNKLLDNSTNSEKPKKNRYQTCVSMIDEFCEKHVEEKELRETLLQYLDLRFEIQDKPLYSNMWKGMLHKLENCLTESDKSVSLVDIVSQSIERGYLSFFPVKKNYNQKSQMYWKPEILSDEDYIKVDENF